MKWDKDFIRNLNEKWIPVFCSVMVLLFMNFEAQSQEANYSKVITQWKNTPSDLLKNKEKLYGMQLPTFTGKTIKGDSFNLSAYEGSVIFLYYTSIHCGPCVTNTENMNRLARDYEENVKFIALTGDTPREIEMYREKKPYLDFTILPHMSYIWANTLYLPPAYPIIMILDRQHKIRYIKMGANPDAEQYWKFIENEVIPVLEMTY